MQYVYDFLWVAATGRYVFVVVAAVVCVCECSTKLYLCEKSFTKQRSFKGDYFITFSFYSVALV